MIPVNSILPHVQKKLRHIHAKVVQEISPFQSGMSLKTKGMRLCVQHVRFNGLKLPW